MKPLLLIAAFFFSITAIGQNPYARLQGELRTMFDPIPIDKGQETEFFNYAITLYNEDSLKKAGQIFDRIYWLDPASKLGKLSLDYRTKIEEIVIKKTNENLNSVWNWNWSGSNWGPTDSPTK